MADEKEETLRKALADAKAELIEVEAVYKYLCEIDTKRFTLKNLVVSLENALGIPRPQSAMTIDDAYRSKA